MRRSGKFDNKRISYDGITGMIQSWSHLSVEAWIQDPLIRSFIIFEFCLRCFVGWNANYPVLLQLNEDRGIHTISSHQQCYRGDKILLLTLGKLSVWWLHLTDISWDIFSVSVIGHVFPISFVVFSSSGGPRHWRVQYIDGWLFWLCNSVDNTTFLFCFVFLFFFCSYLYRWQIHQTWQEQLG